MKSEKKRGCGLWAICAAMFAFSLLMMPVKAYAVEAPVAEPLPAQADIALHFSGITAMTAYGDYITFTANVYYANYIRTEQADVLKKGDTVTLQGISYRVYDLEPGSIYLINSDGARYRIDRTNDSLRRGEGITIAPYRAGYYNVYGYAYEEELDSGKDDSGLILYRNNMRFAMTRDAAVRYLSEGYYGEYLTTDGVGFINGVFDRDKFGWHMGEFRGWITGIENNMAVAVTQEYAE